MTSTTHSLRYALAVLTTPPVTPSAWAHTHLTHQYPATDTQVTITPQAIILNFSEDVETGFSDAKITGPKSENIKTLPAKRSEQGQKQLTVLLVDSLEPGTYTVDWYAVSVDGHKTKRHYTFSVK